MAQENKKQGIKNNTNPAARKKTPKVQVDPYTAELHQLAAKKEVSANDINRMSYLIDDKKAKMNGIGQDGKTLLEKAVRSNSEELFQFLLSKGADINQKNGKLETPLHVAAQLKNPRMMEAVLAANPDVNAQDAKGETALLICVMQNDAHAVSTLLSHKADPNVAAKGGVVPLTEVVDPQIAQELLQNGAHVNVVTDSGKDPLKQAENLQDDKLIATIMDAQLKEEKHVSDPNADVEYKDSTLDKRSELANQSNGPVDAKIKEEQSEEKSETAEQQQEQSAPEAQAQEEQKETVPSENTVSNESKAAENKPEQPEANASSVAAAHDEEERNNNSKGNEEDPGRKAFHAQVLAMRLGITALPKDPAARAAMVADLEEQWTKFSANERVSMALSFFASRSKKQEKTMDGPKKEAKRAPNATQLAQQYKKQRDVA